MQVVYIPLPRPDDENFKGDKPFNVSVAGPYIQSCVKVFLKQTKNIPPKVDQTFPLLKFLLI